MINIAEAFSSKLKIMFEVVTEGPNVFLAVLAVLPLVLLIFKFSKASSSFQPLPPGPPTLPVLGNIHQLGKKPHIALAELAKTYGPLISLKLGKQCLIVGSSSAAATEILKTYDRILSGRHRPNCLPFKNRETENRSLGWAPECDETWKYVRTICQTELFSGKAIESQACLRERKAMELVRILRGMEGKVVNIGELVFATVFNILSNLLLSRDFIELSDGDGDRTKGEMKGLVRELMELSAAPNISDLYPVLAGLDLQGIQKKSSKLGIKTFAIWESIIKEKRERREFDVSKERDFLDVLIADGFTNDQINQLLLELFLAGTDTNTSTVEWMMAELIRNPRSMQRLKEELKKEIKDVLTQFDPSRLPYLQATVRETLRLHPPTPLLLPHRAIETCKVMNYTIPQDAVVMVNVWSIARDPAIWDDPTAFKPERFQNLGVDFKGNDFEFLPFGAGRRLCPGLRMAITQVPLIVASLIHFFDWSLQLGDDPEKLDMSEKFGVTLQKEQPLLLIPKAII